MEAKTHPYTELPGPIAAYFTAGQTDAEALARCFTENAVVLDEGQEHRGRAEIARWKTHTAAKYRFATEPLESRVSGTEVKVLGRVTGDFPGSPVDLRYAFTLKGGAIARLEIAP